jgi:hypothetical protein
MSDHFYHEGREAGFIDPCPVGISGASKDPPLTAATDQSILLRDLHDLRDLRDKND